MISIYDLHRQEKWMKCLRYKYITIWIMYVLDKIYFIILLRRIIKEFYTKMSINENSDWVKKKPPLLGQLKF